MYYTFFACNFYLLEKFHQKKRSTWVYGANGIIGMSDEWREQNSVVIGRVGAYCGTVQFCKGQYWASDNTIVACPKDNGTDVAFLYYLLKYANLNRWAGGAAQPLMTQTVIRQIELPYPEFNVQQKISSILSAYDDLIENNTRRIQILEEMAQLIYREWFIDFEFPVEIQSQPSPLTPLPEGEGNNKEKRHLFPSPSGRRIKVEGHLSTKGYKSSGGKMIDSELGKIPEGWEVKSIMESNCWNFVDEIISKYEGKKEYFATANVEGINIIKDGILVSYAEKPSRAKKQPVLFSVWFARMKETYKVLGFTKVNEDIANRSILSSGFAGFKTSKFNFPFIYLTIKSDEFHQKKDQFCTGATQMSLTNDGLERIKIIVPTKNIIEDFGRPTLPLLDEIFVMQKINKVLRTTRDLLLPKLISGELDISDLDIAIRTENEEK